MLQALRAGWRAPALSSTFRKPQHLVAPLPEGMAPKQSRYMSAEEKRLILMWHDDDDEDIPEIASRLRRDETAVRRFLKKPAFPF